MLEDTQSSYVPSSMPAARADPATGYFVNIDDIRRDEYPMLQGQLRRGKRAHSC